jgi:hypothetical protein
VPGGVCKEQVAISAIHSSFNRDLDSQMHAPIKGPKLQQQHLTSTNNIPMNANGSIDQSTINQFMKIGIKAKRARQK